MDGGQRVQRDIRPGRDARPRFDARRRAHPSAARCAALAEPAGARGDPRGSAGGGREGPVGDGPGAGQPRGLRPDPRRVPGRVAGRARRAPVRDGAVRRLPRLLEQRLAGRVAGVGGRRPASAPCRHGAVRQWHPAGADGVQGAEPAGEGRLRREPHRLPRHDPAAVRPERVRAAVERVARRRSARPTRRGSSSATGR